MKKQSLAVVALAAGCHLAALADVQTAQGSRTTLADKTPPADKAFYVIQVEK